MKIKQTNPSGGDPVFYEIPEDTPIARILGANTFPRDGGPVIVTIMCASGRAWSYEKDQDA